MMGLFEVTEQLYKAKLFLFIISVFNTMISLFSIYAFSLTGILFLAVLSALVFVFNATFVWISYRNWRNMKSMDKEIVVNAK